MIKSLKKGYTLSIMSDLTLALLNLFPVHRHPLSWAAKGDQEQSQGSESRTSCLAFWTSASRAQAPGKMSIFQSIAYFSPWLFGLGKRSSVPSLGRFCHMHKKKKKSHIIHLSLKVFPFSHRAEYTLFKFQWFLSRINKSSPM